MSRYVEKDFITNHIDRILSGDLSIDSAVMAKRIRNIVDSSPAYGKDIPKKPIKPQEDYGTFQCPNCKGLIYTEDEFKTHKFCLMCGQALDWSDKT